MTKHEVKEQFVLKASLAELFAALDGVVCAGVTATAKGGNTKTDPLASLGYHAAMLSLNMKADIGFARTDMDENAFQITEFLNAASSVLQEYPETRLSLPKGKRGGKIRELSRHIDEILTREDTGGARPPLPFLDGRPMQAFNAAYLPSAAKASRQDAPADPDIADRSVEAKATRRKHWGRQRSFV